MNRMVIKSGDTPEKQIVYGEVYAPNRPDADGEFMTADSIEQMAHDFARKSELGLIDIMHDGQVIPGCCVVETFIARKGDPDFLEGAWVVGVHIADPTLWGRIKKGELNGFSMEAMVWRHEQEAEVEIPPVVMGMTTKSEDHEHKFYVSYDGEGKFKGGTTDTMAGHFHVIKAGTHTEETNGHTHRFSAVDNLQIKVQ